VRHAQHQLKGSSAKVSSIPTATGLEQQRQNVNNSNSSSSSSNNNNNNNKPASQHPRSFHGG